MLDGEHSSNMLENLQNGVANLRAKGFRPPELQEYQTPLRRCLIVCRRLILLLMSVLARLGAFNAIEV